MTPAERVLDVKVDGSKLLVTDGNSFFACRYREPKPEEQVALGPDDLSTGLLRECHRMACATAKLDRPDSKQWTRLSRSVTVI